MIRDRSVIGDVVQANWGACVQHLIALLTRRPQRSTIPTLMPRRHAPHRHDPALCRRRRSLSTQLPLLLLLQSATRCQLRHRCRRQRRARRARRRALANCRQRYRRHGTRDDVLTSRGDDDVLQCVESDYHAHQATTAASRCACACVCVDETLCVASGASTGRTR
jgi:hypothetical protein